MLRLFVLTVPFLVMAALFYAGFIITASKFAAIMSMICLVVAAVILFRYNVFLHRMKKERQTDDTNNEPASQEE